MYRVLKKRPVTIFISHPLSVIMLVYRFLLTLLVTVIFTGRQSYSFCSFEKNINCTTINFPRCHECALDCNYEELYRIPENLPRETGCLFASNNHIRHLAANELTALHQLVELDLSSNKIESIEDEAFKDVGSTLKSLRIHQNKLQVINKKTFAGLVCLVSLHIDHNLIATILAGAFDDLVDLNYLEAGNNKLNFSDYKSLPIGCFRKMTELRHLEIHGNIVKGLMLYRGDLLQNLTNLTQIRMDGISNGVALPEEFKQVSSLKQLRIYGEEFNMIHNETFVNLGGSTLERLEIIDTSLEMIEDMAFSHLTHLQNLRITNSTIGLCRVQNAWLGLQKTMVKRLTITHVVNPYSNYMFLPCNFFKHLGYQSQNIESLNLEGNNLIYIDNQISSNLSSLETLSIEFNRLQSIHTLQCSDETEDFSRNPREIITCYNYCNNHTVTGGNKNFLSDKEEMGSGILHLPKSIKRLEMSAAIRFDSRIVPEIRLVGCSNLNYIRYRSSNINRFHGPIHFDGNGSTGGIYIDFRGNYATYLDTNFFGNATIVYLDFGDNALAKQLSKDYKGNTFQTYDSLETLNISNNDIKTLPEHIFTGLVKLRELNVSQNSLSHFFVKLSHMENLRIIDFTKNLFVMLHPETMQHLDQFSANQRTPLEIDLRWNIFVCTCETLNFTEWILADLRTTKLHQRSYRCFFKSKFIKFGVYQDSHRTELMTICNSKSYLFVSLALSLVTLLTLVVTVVVHRHRWDIKFFIVRWFKRRQWNEFLQAEENEPYQFHAFVAYHDDDILWVKDELLRNLENTATTETNRQTISAFKLCVHDRDFLPGVSIEDNILEGIRSSKKCIVVLTRSFLASGWCEFELQMARFDCFEKKKNTIIVVMLEPIPLEMLTPSLVALIRRTTILEWSYASKNHPLFWDKMRQALTSSELTPLICECGRSIRQMWTTREDSDSQVGHFQRTVSLN